MLALWLLACHRVKDVVPVETPTWEDPDGAAVWVGGDGVVRLVAPGGATRTLELAFGYVSQPDPSVNYDPWNLYDTSLGAVPSGLAFATADAAEWTGEDYALTLDNGATARLTVDDAGPGLRLRFEQGEGEPWAPYVRVTALVAGSETFYGLGEVFGRVQHRGTVVPMQFELRTDLESGYNEAHVPVPLLVSNAGWGLLADSYLPGVFDVAATDDARVQVVFQQLDGFTFDLYAPNSPALVTARYHQRTGPPEVPPTWAFAPLQWRNVVADQGVVLEDAAAIRANGVPTGLIWVDNPWQTTYNSMVPDPAMFPDWDGMVATLAAQGFEMMAWSTPYLEEGDPDHAAYAAAGWFVDAPLLFSDFGDWVDLTHPDASAAWQGRVAAAAARGIHGWKLDYGEDAQLGVGAGRLVYPFANGEDERTMHHRYARYYHEAYAAPYADRSGFVLGRAGVLGGHTVTDCIWPGDLDNDFSTWEEEVDGELRVGGLPSAIRAGTGLAVSGYPFFASDTGGYRHGRPTAEVMVRWTEYAALLPVFQYGGGGENHNPWDFTAYEDSVFDADTLAAFTRYAVLHIRLFPYFWRLAERARDEGLPTVLPQGLAYPGAGADPDDVFLVGDDLLVAPVAEPGATSRALTLPPGAWVHWWTGERYDGDAVIDVAAPLGEGPLFQRVGSAVPMLRRTVMTLGPTDGSVDSWADDPGRLNARVVPGPGAAFALSTGEALTADDALVLTPGDLYSGWDVEIWAPGATGADWNGVALPVGAEGCTDCVLLDDRWVRVVVDGAGTIDVR